ncbi:MAG: hypothetical protein U5R06_03095 [candidate division KSB1 bacterium]|nr:hypothetical protein [candidate division KSB1 bacterium]
MQTLDDLFNHNQTRFPDFSEALDKSFARPQEFSDHKLCQIWDSHRANSVVIPAITIAGPTYFVLCVTASDLL